MDMERVVGDVRFYQGSVTGSEITASLVGNVTDGCHHVDFP